MATTEPIRSLTGPDSTMVIRDSIGVQLYPPSGLERAVQSA